MPRFEQRHTDLARFGFLIRAQGAHDLWGRRCGQEQARRGGRLRTRRGQSEGGDFLPASV